MILDKHHPFYMAWCNMKTRCNNPKSTQYKWYGAKGIQVCPAWSSFTNFYQDMFPEWRPGLSLDRLDNNKGYSKDNCRWVILQAQASNRGPRAETTHCFRGHELTPENSIYYSNGARTCRICREAYNNLPEVKNKRNESHRERRRILKALGLPWRNA